jgi:nucleoside-diphosphate-sugar epimerase
MSDETPHSATPVRTIVILGAGGYLGSALCQFFHQLPSHRIVAVSRGTLRHRFFHKHVVADVFADAWAGQVSTETPSVLINCAFDFKTIERGSNDGKFATFERNIAALASPSARLINISSMSAFAGCRTDYGREKLLVEDLFGKLGGINIRPGLIASWRRPGAAFLNIIGIATGSKVVPILAARGSGFYFCDLEAVILGIHLLAGMTSNTPRTLSFCYRERIKLGDLLRLIETQKGTRSVKVPVPWQIAYLMLLAKEKLIGKSKVRADSILDFAYPNPVPEERAFFAGIVADFRGDLEGLPNPGAGGDFYFLEGERRTAGKVLPPDVLGVLADARSADAASESGNVS